MKKLILSAFSLSVMLFPAAISASNTVANTVISITAGDDERQTVKAEELPAGVKKTLDGEDYKGYTISTAAWVKSADASYYEVSLAKDKETKIVKIDKEGKLLK
jgi:hypothetical protein